MSREYHLAIVAAAALLSGLSQGEQVRYQAPKPKSTHLPGGFAALVDPTTEALYQGEDPWTGETEFSYVAIYDTGASGLLMSRMVRGTFGVPVTGETYQDIGIGGYETFDVTVATRLLLAPNSVGAGGADNLANYSAYGPHKFQAKQQDNLLVGPFDIIGTPVLQDFVMHVQPNDPVPFHSDYPYIDYMRTDLLTEVPCGLPAQGVLRLPLVYQNFVEVPDPPVSVAENPVIPGVKIVDGRKGPAEQSAPRDWLFDTGATLTIIGEDYAAEVGIGAGESPLYDAEVIGVGGQLRTLYGYVVDELVLPMTNGDEVVFEDAVVFVPETGALPADLPGIVGMNLIAPAFSQQSWLGYPSDVTDAIFSDWYVDSIGPVAQLILVDPNSTYAPMAGDLNGDDAVDRDDLALLLGAFGTGDPGWADLDFDGDCDRDDLAAFLGTYDPASGAGTGAPEPATALLVGAGLLGLARRRGGRTARSA